jgi:type VI secretion system secreted protein Hcp
VSIEGTKQGKFKGESIREAHKDKIAGLAFRYGVQSPRDVATGQASGKRQHQPVVFVKEWGPATPQIFQACTTNEVLKSVLFEFVHTTAEGSEEIYHTIKLSNATVSSIAQRMTEPQEGGARRGGSESKELEEIALTFQTIEIENKVGKTMAADDWTK